MNTETFCFKLPKIELHAHLNGSLSMDALNKLLELKRNTQPQYVTETNSLHLEEFNIENGKSRSLSQCFAVFKIAQSLTDTPTSVKLATILTLEEFDKDNVIYLELRSTPRENENMTKSEYIQAMVDAIIDSSNKFSMKTALIISIDRRQTFEQAKQTVCVAIEMHQKYPEIILGLDLSGDPNVNKFDDFAPILQVGRKAGLKTTIHTAEIQNDEETKKILEWSPDRIGHATCMSGALWDLLLESKIPTELCLTSNVKCEVVKSYGEHHFEQLYTHKYPICLATDDKGVFTTSLSEEFRICAETFNLSRVHLYELAYSTVDYIFGSDRIKQELKEQYQMWRQEFEKYII